MLWVTVKNYRRFSTEDRQGIGTDQGFRREPEISHLDDEMADLGSCPSASKLPNRADFSLPRFAPAKRGRQEGGLQALRRSHSTTLAFPLATYRSTLLMVFA